MASTCHVQDQLRALPYFILTTSKVLILQMGKLKLKAAFKGTESVSERVRI